MRIALLGSGAVGRSLAVGFARTGNQVVLGSRDPSSASALAWLDAVGEQGHATNLRSAASSADVVVFAVPGRALPEVVELLRPATLDGSVIIDPTNPVVFDDDEVVSAFGAEDSAAEFLQRSFPAARVVKAFNQIPAAQMGSPDPESRTPLRICGDDSGAKEVVSQLAEGLGWQVRDLGPLTRARALEKAAIDWMRSQHTTG